MQELYPLALDRGISLETFWGSSVPEILDLLEAKARQEQEELRDRIRLQFVQADAVASRVGYLFTDKKKRRKADILMPWDVYPDLFKDDKKKAEEKADKDNAVAQKAVMEALASRWNNYRKAKDNGELNIQHGSSDQRGRKGSVRDGEKGQ